MINFWQSHHRQQSDHRYKPGDSIHPTASSSSSSSSSPFSKRTRPPSPDNTLPWDQRLRLFLHDATVSTTASSWYNTLLSRLPDSAHVLDVGIGTGIGLLTETNINILRAKNISIIGLHTDPNFIKQCRDNIASAQVENHVSAYCASPSSFSVKSRFFTHVYFGGSFMSMQENVKHAKAAVELLADREDGRIVFAESFHVKKCPWKEWFLPNLKGVTESLQNGHLLGNVVYQEDFEQCLHQANLTIVNTVSLDGDDNDDNDDDNDDLDEGEEEDEIGKGQEKDDHWNSRRRSYEHVNETHRRNNFANFSAGNVSARTKRNRPASKHDRQRESLLIYARSKLYVPQEKETVN